MIKLLQEGKYDLIETKGQTKILFLGKDKVYAWINAKNIGEILISTYKSHKADYLLSTGKFRLYKVKEEPNFVDLIHLELLVGEGIWQGYLLPTGLPDSRKNRNRIIPTKEIITKSIN